MLLVFFLVSAPLLSQTYIGQNRKRVKNRLEQYAAEATGFTGSLQEAGDSITLILSTADILPTRFIYHFDEAGKCKSEKVIANCDSCFNKYLQAALDRKEYHWKKINENQYVSDYDNKLLLEVPPENTNFSFQVLKLAWSREQYRMMTGN
jgi:hypothetical protein